MRLLVLLSFSLGLALAACSKDSSDNDCACTVSVDDASLALACGAQGCLAGYGYGCEEDDVVSLGTCEVDFAAPPVRNDAGVGICLAARADCTGATLPCCTTDAGTAPTCDPTSLLCCVATGAPCTRTNDCCDGRSCVVLGGQNVCGS